jgi:FMN phosphatase YigB (HAD superfamily)
MADALNQLGGEFESVTYYGDGEWDEAASRSLGWEFVPVGERLGGLTRFKPIGA